MSGGVEEGEFDDADGTTDFWPMKLGALSLSSVSRTNATLPLSHAFRWREGDIGHKGDRDEPSGVV